MELRRLCLWTAFFTLAAVMQCSEARHSVNRRAATDDMYDDDILQADAASDDDTQNDGDGGDDQEDEREVHAVILTQPAHYNSTIGSNVRLECKVSPPDADAVVQWLRDGTVYFIGNQKAGAPDRFSIDVASTDLLIKDVRQTDSGTYRCMILQTEPVYIEHTVLVQESPRIIRFVASNGGQVMEGSDLQLTCEVAGSPPPQIVWSREGENGNQRLEEKDGEFSYNTVHMRNVRRDHSGKYYCYVFNGVGHNQAELTVKVYGKPRVHVHKTVVNSAINVEAVLQCSAHEEPPIHIRWYKDGVLIEDSSSRFTVSTYGQNSNLTVIPMSSEDFGTFTCEAENDYGKHNRSVELLQNPVVEDLQVEGNKLTWTVHSHQPLEHIELQLRDMNGNGDWKILEVPLPETQKHEYEIIYVLDNKDLDSGKYEVVVRAKNTDSWSDHSNREFIDIEARPEYIQHASVYRGNSHSIRPVTTILSTTLMYLLVRML